MTPNADPSTISAGTAVRTAFDANSSYSGYGLEITPQGDHLVLKGTVSDESAKKSVLKTAKSAAGDVKIEDQLTVKTQ